MKALLTMACVTGLNGALLYPLFIWGSGQSLNGMIEAALLVVGLGGLYLLYRFRRSFS